MWRSEPSRPSNPKNNALKEMELVDVIKISEMQFYPSVKTALAILLTQPCTTCTIERSFSTVVLNRWSAKLSCATWLYVRYLTLFLSTYLCERGGFRMDVNRVCRT
ncbi:hypothetical protein B5X24_HaOG209024 [Helicoverpa armigera]|uniref:HAT C-terminal dimerisation domain-containing protein n=1 Tax=Helicoverpa armigera TaxID=29058 RepID=A0A2W1BLR6_HELAM|nr:hypothetical protein B5X24_HaOG209024 [Helicoverpa armigera]